MSDAVILVLISHQGETMKRKYEHRPGLFGLASIAAGWATKDREDRTKQKSTVPGGHSRMQSKSRSRSVKKQRNHSDDSGSDVGSLMP